MVRFLQNNRQSMILDRQCRLTVNLLPGGPEEPSQCLPVDGIRHAPRRTRFNEGLSRRNRRPFALRLQMVQAADDGPPVLRPFLRHQFRVTVQNGIPSSKRNRGVADGLHAQTLPPRVDVYAIAHNASLGASQNINSSDDVADTEIAGALIGVLSYCNTDAHMKAERSIDRLVLAKGDSRAVPKDIKSVEHSADQLT